MAKPDIFDDIIACLREQAKASPETFVERGELNDFFTDFKKAPPRIQPRIQPASPPRTQTQAQMQTPQCAAASDGPIENMTFDELAASVAACRKCRLCETRTNTVFGDGDPKAALMFIGEGPGADEDAQGLPFVGRAGELLTRMINAMQFDRKAVFIANIVKCRPPNNRAPADDEMAACLPFIRRQIELTAPKAIVMLGATPLKALFGLSGITRLRGKFLDYNGIKVMPTFHPAYLLRNPPAKADVWKDLQTVMALFGKKYIPRGK